MNKIRPYLFWIVCGVLLIVEFVIMLVVAPSNPQAAGKTVVDTKRAADAAFDNELMAKPSGIHTRALMNLASPSTFYPPTHIPPEDTAKVEDLLNRYLIDRTWQANFKSVVSNYQSQIRDIHNDLKQRSEPLSQAISTSGDVAEWYDAYERQSASLLRQALDAGLVEPPRTGLSPDTGSAGPSNAELRERPEWRRMLGLFTKPGNQFPQISEHPLLTTKFRIIEQVVSTLINADAVAKVNPLIPDKYVRPPTTPEVVTVTEFTIDGMPTLDVVPDAEMIGFTLTMTGSPAALQAAVCALDGIHSPMVIRLGGEWRKVTTSARSRTPGSRDLQDLETAPMEFKARYVVLDFRPMQDASIAALTGDATASSEQGPQ